MFHSLQTFAQNSTSASAGPGITVVLILFFFTFLTNYRSSKIPKPLLSLQTDTETSQTISLATAMRPDFFFFSLPDNACWRADVRPVTRAGLHHKLCNFLQTGRGRLPSTWLLLCLRFQHGSCSVLHWCFPPGSTATTSLSPYSATSRLLRLYQHAGYHLVLLQQGGKAPSSHLPSPVNWLASMFYYVHVLTEGVQVCTCISAWYQNLFSLPTLISKSPPMAVMAVMAH